MNSLERYLSMLKGKAVDFVPRMPILMQFAAESIGSNYGAFASDYRVLVEANLQCAEVFGMDQVSAISDPYRETQGFGAGIDLRARRRAALRAPSAGRPQGPLRAAATRPASLGAHAGPRQRRARLQGASRRPAAPILGWIEGPAAETADLRT